MTQKEARTIRKALLKLRYCDFLLINEIKEYNKTVPLILDKEIEYLNTLISEYNKIILFHIERGTDTDWIKMSQIMGNKKIGRK